jgi:hypothetical protein
MADGIQRLVMKRRNRSSTQLLLHTPLKVKRILCSNKLRQASRHLCRASQVCCLQDGAMFRY